MSDKDVVLETLGQLPESATLEQISEEIAILAAKRKGKTAADAGQVMPHAELPEKLASELSEQDAERKQWTDFSLRIFAGAYSDEEPEYTVADLRS